MQIRLDLSIYLCLSKVHSDLILRGFVDIFSYIIVPLMDCFSQEQNPSYSYEPHNPCKGEGDGGNSYSVTESRGVSGCTGRYGVGSPEALQAPSTTPKFCVIIWFYLPICYCLFPLWENLGFEHGNLNILQICLCLSSQNYCAYLEVTATGHGVVWQFVQGVEKGWVPSDCCEGPWPWRRLWDKVSAAVLRTEHATCSPAPFSAAAVSEHKSCVAAWPEEGHECCRHLQRGCGKVLAQSERSTWFL